MDGVGGEHGIRTGGGKGRIHEYYHGISTSAARPDKYGNRVAVAVRQAMMTRAQFAEIWRD